MNNFIIYNKCDNLLPDVSNRLFKKEMNMLALEKYPIKMGTIGDEEEWDMNKQYRECWRENMIIETKEVYKCEYCRKLYQIKKACELHEPMCKKNPKNKMACYGCRWLEKKGITYIWDAYDGEHESSKEIMFCRYKNEGVYPYWVKNPLLEDDILNEIPNNVMPKECDKFELVGA